MKIKELIEHLEQLNPDLYVFVPGYEGGYSDVTISHIKEIALNVNEDWWYGKHDDVDNPKVEKGDYEIVKGIIL